MSRKVTINNSEFNSKTKAEEYAKTILNKYKIHESLNTIDFNFMKSYFQYFHYEWKIKEGVGIENIYIKKSDWGNNEFWIKRIDKSRTDISYKLNKIEKPNYKNWLESSFRNAISEDILLFKSNAFNNNKFIICEITNQKLTEDEVDIDHHEISFKTISDNFISLKEIQINAELFQESQDQQMIPQLVDSKINEEFKLYHLSVCKLRAISKSANRSILKKK